MSKQKKPQVTDKSSEGRASKKVKQRNGSNVSKESAQMDQLPSITLQMAPLGEEGPPAAFGLIHKYLEALDRASVLPRAAAQAGPPGSFGPAVALRRADSSSLATKATPSPKAALAAGPEQFVASTNLSQGPASDGDTRAGEAEGEGGEPKEKEERSVTSLAREAAARYFRERLLLDLLRRAPPPPPPSAAAATETLRSVLKDVLSKRASAAAPKESVLLTDPAAGPELPDEWRLAATRMPLAFQEQLRNEQNVGLREGPGASDAAGLPLWPGRASGAGAWARRRDARPHTVGGRLRCGGHVAAGRKPRHGLRERARVVGGGGGGGGARGAHLDQRPATQPARLAPPPPGAPGAAARAGVRCVSYRGRKTLSDINWTNYFYGTSSFNFSEQKIEKTFETDTRKSGYFRKARKCCPLSLPTCLTDCSMCRMARGFIPPPPCPMPPPYADCPDDTPPCLPPERYPFFRPVSQTNSIMKTNKSAVELEKPEEKPPPPDRPRRRKTKGAGDRPRPPWVGPCAPPPPSPRQRQETLRRQTARASAAAIARRTAAAAAQGAASDKRHRGAAPSAAAPGVASVAAAPDTKAPHHKKDLGAKDNGAAGNSARDSVA